MPFFSPVSHAARLRAKRQPVLGACLRTCLRTCAASFVAIPCTAHAQIDIGAALREVFGKAVRDALADINTHRVAVTPALATVDPKTLTASVELQNRSRDTLDAELTVGNAPPDGGFGGDVPDSAKANPSPLLADDAPESGADSAAAGKKTVETSHSLAPWVTGLPSHVRLAPGEKKTVTVKLDVPASRAAGEYAAWLLATTKFGEAPAKPKPNGKGKGDSVQVKVNGGARLQGGARLVYRAE